MARKPEAGREENGQQEEARVKSQIERFKEAARGVGADESAEAFERAFRKIVPPKPRAKRG
jgi:hypothetical protein